MLITHAATKQVGVERTKESLTPFQIAAATSTQNVLWGSNIYEGLMNHSTLWDIKSSQQVISSQGNVPHLNHYCPITPTLLGATAWLQHHISNGCVWSATN